MNRLYVMVGIPASGKSTWARAHLPGCIIVSTDEIREELWGNAATTRGGRRVMETARQRVAATLRSGKDVAYDATNTRPADRTDLLDRLRREGLSFEAVAVVMEAKPQQAIAQQKGRVRKVPTAAIRHFYRILVPPSLDEGFAEIIRVPASLQETLVKEETSCRTP